MGLPSGALKKEEEEEKEGRWPETDFFSKVLKWKWNRKQGKQRKEDQRKKSAG